MTDWKAAFPELAALSDPIVAETLNRANRVTLDPGVYVFHAGAACLNYLLVLTGDVRVQMVTDTGRAVTLYHVNDRDSCVLTTACLLGQTAYPAEGIVDRPTTALAIAKAEFDRAMAASSGMRQFVFANLGQRFSEVIVRIEEIVFASIDRRLANWLLDHSDGNMVHSTHQELATETGTAREVISRHLKRLEEKGWLRLMRGKIEIVDHEALRSEAGRSA